MSNRILSLACMAVMAAMAAPQPARAQAMPMAEAVGKPLPDAKLAPGTVTVKVVDGQVTKPIEGVTVELVAAKGQTLAARTNPSGRATFSKLKPGASYVGRVSIERDDGENKTVETEPFTVPESGGLRFLLSPTALTMPAGAAAPGGGGGQPAMDPRRVSGIPRPDAQDPAGRLTVRAVYGEFHPTESRAPVGAKIHLVGYGADGTVSVVTKTMDESERVTFDNLVTGGRTVYYLVSLFERDGVVDRLVSQPITMMPRVGTRILLSGEKKGSGKPAVDDLVQSEALDAPGPGHVEVRVAGQGVDGIDAVELVELGRPGVVAKAKLVPATPSGNDIMGMADTPRVVPQQVEPAIVTLSRVSSGGHAGPLAGMTVTLRAARDDAVLATSVTGADGQARLMADVERKPETQYVTVVSVYGKEFRSQPFSLPAKGGVAIAYNAGWRSSGLAAQWDGVASGKDSVYVARLHYQGHVYRSTPFQLARDRGAALQMLIYPGLVFSFHGGGEVDDQNFWFDMQFTLYNPSKEPYLPEEGGVDIPLPAGFKAAEVKDEFAARVQVTKKGLLWRGAVPPGGTSFVATFALPVSDGRMSFDMPLPMGAFRSQLIMRKSPGMTLVDAEGKPPTETRRNGKSVKILNDVPLIDTPDREGRPLVVVGELNVPKNQKLVLGIHGLPQRPAWQSYVRTAVGLLVLVILAWGVRGVARGGAGGNVRALEARKEELLERLVELERKKKGNGKAAKRVREELAEIFEQLGTGTDT